MPEQPVWYKPFRDPELPTGDGTGSDINAGVDFGWIFEPTIADPTLVTETASWATGGWTDLAYANGSFYAKIRSLFLQSSSTGTEIRRAATPNSPAVGVTLGYLASCLLYTSPSPRDS